MVIQNNEGLDKLKKSMNTFNAPCAIVLCANPDKAWTRSYDGKKITDIDASIVLTHMMLEATNQGLDNVWVCNFRPDILRTEFNVPSEYEITSVLLIGYGVSEPLSPQRHDKTRKKTEDLFIFETF
ncbi:MAG: Nitroreductase family protein [Alphaproteobacteria bacterium ADurb.Bin438]|nr:MAG: Nitroreductase family protein [Alphaproteobacteria bacterium ADurb.Bin438]